MVVKAVEGVGIVVMEVVLVGEVKVAVGGGVVVWVGVAKVVEEVVVV